MTGEKPVAMKTPTKFSARCDSNPESVGFGIPYVASANPTTSEFDVIVRLTCYAELFRRATPDMS